MADHRRHPFSRSQTSPLGLKTCQAREMFTKHDSTLAARQVPCAATVADHDQHSLIFLPICPKWRSLRKISAVHLFSNQRLDAGQELRQKKVNELVVYIRSCCYKGEIVEIAGTEAPWITVEWAITELLRHPEKLTKAQAEIDQVIGKDGTVQESDIPKLSYIQAIIKEIFRLHPAAPFLVPRKAEKEVQLCDYYVPKDAQIWVNIWLIGRDPNIWSNPESFVPERFLGRDIDIKGQDFELIPFGSGRRICPGMSLGHRMVHVILATLVHSFNWKLPNGTKPKDIDMEDNFGLTLRKAQPLRVIPHFR